MGRRSRYILQTCIQHFLRAVFAIVHVWPRSNLHLRAFDFGVLRNALPAKAKAIMGSNSSHARASALQPHLDYAHLRGQLPDRRVYLHDVASREILGTLILLQRW